MKWSAFRTGLRDVVGTATGAFILYQQVTGPAEKVNYWLVGAGVLLLSAPGAIGLFSLFRGNVETPDIPSPPSRSRASSSRRR